MPARSDSAGWSRSEVEILVRQQNVEEALALVLAQAASGEPAARLLSAKLHRELWNFAESERIIELLSTEGIVAADRIRREWNAERDDPRAIAVLENMAHAGYSFARTKIAGIHAAAGRLSEAESNLRSAIAQHDEAALRLYAALLRQHGRVDELRHRATMSDRYAARELARLLADRGDIDEATAVLQRAIDLGDVGAEWLLGSLREAT